MPDEVRTVMNSRWTWLATGVVIGLILAGGALTAKEQPTSVTEVQESMTIFLGVHGGKDTAKKLNQACKSYGVAGWHFVDFEPNVENGDQKGA